MIGLSQDVVKLVPYHAEWKDLYKEEEILLKGTLGSLILAIEHIGSTAVPGMQAKPIIDIAIGLTDLKLLAKIQPLISSLGYEEKIQHSTATRKLFTKGPEHHRTHHIHFVLYQSEEWNNFIYFREALTNNNALKEAYIALKTDLAAIYADNRPKYTEAKDKFIQTALKE